MPITEFNNFTDGLQPNQREREHYITNTDLNNEKLWIPYVEGVWFQACNFNLTSGGFSNILKINPDHRLNPHYHIGTVHGLTLSGRWRYLEHDWTAVAGTYIYEPAGEAHTLVVEHEVEPMITFFVVQAGLIYLDKVVGGKVVGYDDGYTLLELARKHYRNVGLDLTILDKMIR